jgi:diguanylate cyclase (GGDEF)-like protein
LHAIPSAVAELANVFERRVEHQVDFEALRTSPEQQLSAMVEQYESLVTSLDAIVQVKESLEAQLQETTDRLEKLSMLDPLTHVFNRGALEAALIRDLARADRDLSYLSVILLDIDHLKTVNDSWGYATGDAVLAMIGKVLKGSLRTGDVVGRIASDEFLCILPNTDNLGATVVAERIRTLLPRQAVVGPKGPILVTASFGVSTIRGPGCRTALDDLLGHADESRALAKHQGRDCVVNRQT